MTFEHIITVCEHTTKHLTDLTSDYMSIYTPYITLKLYGIPAEWDEEKIEDAINCEEEALPLGEISGYLVLGQALSLIGGDILEYCDCADYDIENAASALMERGGPLNEDSNLFHITDFNISESVDADEVQKLLIELPDIIFTHMHVTPDIISVSPYPLPHEKSKLEQVQEGLAMMAYNETNKRINKQMFGQDSDDEDMDTPQIQISPEQLNIVLGRRNEGDTYPEQYIDRKAWQPFLDTGYTEWLKTRVLYKETL